MRVRKPVHTSVGDASGTLVAPPVAVYCTHEPGVSCTPTDGSALADGTPASAVPTGALQSCDTCATAASTFTGTDEQTATGGFMTTGSSRNAAVTRQSQINTTRARTTLRSMHPTGSRLRSTPFSNLANRTPVMLAAQQRSILSYTQTAPMDRTWWRLLGRRQLTDAQNLVCLCNHPLTPDLVQYIQHLLHCESVHLASSWNASATPNSNQQLFLTPVESHLAHRRGSEASQLLAWKHRLNQYAGLFEPDAPEPAFGPHLRPVTNLSSIPNQQSTYVPTLNPSPSNPSPGSNTSPIRLSPAPKVPNGRSGVQPHSDLVEPQLSLPTNLAPTSPPGIELNDLKTELHKLETENCATVATTQLPRLPVTSVGDEDSGSGVVSPASSLISQYTTCTRAGDPRRHYMNTGCRYQQSTESSISPLRASPSSNTATRTPRVSLTGADVSFEQNKWVPHRVSSLKVPRRASSAVAGMSSRGQQVRHSPNGDPTLHGVSGGTLLDCSLPRRHRYSVGDSLDHAIITMTDELNCPSTIPSDTPPYTPLSCQPSVTGLHSQPGQHRTIVPTLSNPDHALSAQLAAHLPSGRFIPPEDHDRTALSSPGPAGTVPFLDLSLAWSQAQSQLPVSEAEAGLATATGPSSAGVKRRLFAPVHGKSSDYLRTLQRAGGSLDRRLNFDMFNSPKRKASVFIQFLVLCYISFPPVVPPTALNTTPFLVDTHQNVTAQQQQQQQPVSLFGRNQAPNLFLNSPSPLSFAPNPIIAANYTGSAGLSGTLVQSVPPTTVYGLPNDPHSAAAAAAASLMLLRPGDDDEDLAEIDRVNQRLAMGKLSDFAFPGAFVNPDTSSSSSRNFSTSEAPSNYSGSEQFPEPIDHQ
ncbi:unnamed protein product [Echinostoma caproni]|uniref:Uncharacterized protein n=1 Tax=Echinostoma caproni TaxID=27848 RepID=A0A183A7X0_9TREM|nr:unnamed protein product [Echinostoma caproni]